MSGKQSSIFSHEIALYYWKDITHCVCKMGGIKDNLFKNQLSSFSTGNI